MKRRMKNESRLGTWKRRTMKKWRDEWGRRAACALGKEEQWRNEETNEEGEPLGYLEKKNMKKWRDGWGRRAAWALGKEEQLRNEETNEEGEPLAHLEKNEKGKTSEHGETPDKQRGKKIRQKFLSYRQIQEFRHFWI